MEWLRGDLGSGLLTMTFESRLCGRRNSTSAGLRMLRRRLSIRGNTNTPRGRGRARNRDTERVLSRTQEASSAMKDVLGRFKCSDDGFIATATHFGVIHSRGDSNAWMKV